KSVRRPPAIQLLSLPIHRAQSEARQTQQADPGSQRSEIVANALRLFTPGIKESANRRLRLRADGEDSQAEAVLEREAGEFATKLLPDLPHAEIPIAHRDVVK